MTTPSGTPTEVTFSPELLDGAAAHLNTTASELDHLADTVKSEIHKAMTAYGSGAIPPIYADIHDVLRAMESTFTTLNAAVVSRVKNDAKTLTTFHKDMEEQQRHAAASVHAIDHK